jgi:hypothetical protein
MNQMTLGPDYNRMILRIVVPALAVIATVVPAEARYACAVKRTPDGFVALRDGPSARHKMIAQMRYQELVGLLHPDKDEIVREGDWLFVRWYPGTKRTATHIPDADEAKAKAGWVRDRLIDCFEE